MVFLRARTHDFRVLVAVLCIAFISLTPSQSSRAATTGFNEARAQVSLADGSQAFVTAYDGPDSREIIITWFDRPGEQTCRKTFAFDEQGLDFTPLQDASMRATASWGYQCPHGGFTVDLTSTANVTDVPQLARGTDVWAGWVEARPPRPAAYVYAGVTGTRAATVTGTIGGVAVTQTKEAVIVRRQRTCLPGRSACPYDYV